MKKIAVFTGAGISSESGLQTFRGKDGLWEGHRVEDVTTPEGWRSDPEMVHKFYNQRRNACRKALPNLGHLALVELEKYAHVEIITQNIDDLHERAGSTRILHLHGEIMKAQSARNPQLIYPILSEELTLEDRAEDGARLRPNVVWFGEPVPNMNLAIQIVKRADILLIIGTSLQVYPAANLIYEVNSECEIFIIDPNVDTFEYNFKITPVKGNAAIEVPKWVNSFAEYYSA